MTENTWKLQQQQSHCQRRRFLIQVYAFVGVLLGVCYCLAGPNWGINRKDTQVAGIADGTCSGRQILDGQSMVSVAELIRASSDLYEVDEKLLLAVILAESNCRQELKSPRGAIGMMQVMPATARWLGVQNVHSPRNNINAGAKYLAYLLERSKGNVQLALAAYNAGPQAVKKHGGVPPYRETRTYIKRVLQHYENLRQAEARKV